MKSILILFRAREVLQGQSDKELKEKKSVHIPNWQASNTLSTHTHSHSLRTVPTAPIILDLRPLRMTLSPECGDPQLDHEPPHSPPLTT